MKSEYREKAAEVCALVLEGYIKDLAKLHLMPIDGEERELRLRGNLDYRNSVIFFFYGLTAIGIISDDECKGLFERLTMMENNVAEIRETGEKNEEQKNKSRKRCG